MENKQGRGMTYPEALRRAEKLWGAAGAVELRRTVAPELSRVVGTKGAPPERTAIGYGRTWAEAFANAGAP